MAEANAAAPSPSGATPGERASAPAEADYEGMRQRLVRAVARICPRWLAAQADDIVQAALIRVMEILRTREGDRPLAASYLWKVAYSVTVDEIRRVRRRRELSLDDDAPETLAATGDSDPEQARRSGETTAALADCLQRLVEARRLAVTLHLQGHSVPELARLLGWAAKRADNLVYRGLADLRRCLLSKGVNP